MKMRNAAVVIVLSSALSVTTVLGADLDPALQTILGESESVMEIPVLVELSDHVDLSVYDGGRESAGAMIRALRQKAEETHPILLDFLASRGVVEVKEYWICTTTL